MRKWLAGVALLAVLLAPTPALSQPLGAAQYAYQYVCEILQEVLCETLPAPEIRFANLPGNTQGMYSSASPNVVWMDIRYRSTLQDIWNADPYAVSILVHEVTHYVHVQTARIHSDNPDYWPDRCGAEAMAWSVGNTWLVQRGLRHLAIWNWRWWYRC